MSEPWDEEQGPFVSHMVGQDGSWLLFFNVGQMEKKKSVEGKIPPVVVLLNLVWGSKCNGAENICHMFTPAATLSIHSNTHTHQHGQWERPLLIISFSPLDSRVSDGRKR